MSNNERQRRFQARHPGYDARRKARRRSGAKRALKKLKAEWQAMAAAEAAQMAAAAQASAAPGSVMLISYPDPRRALPAPVEQPELAAINDLRVRLAAVREIAAIAA